MAISRDEKKPFELALITGATSGIGYALSHLLAEMRVDLILSGRDSGKLDGVVSELNPKVNVIAVTADLATAEGKKTLIDAIWRYIPNLIINSAGLGLYGEALSRRTDEQLRLLDLNANAPVAIALEGARAMIKAKKSGVILNVSSVAAFPPFPGMAAYSASKALMNQFSLSFDEEVKPFGIRVLAACPGVVATNFRPRAGSTAGYRDGDMSATTAAKEIWRQIVSRRQLRIFNWRYRIALFIVRCILPNWLMAKIMNGALKNIYPKETQSLILKETL